MEDDKDYKICIKCQLLKPINKFNIADKNNNRRRTECKECISLYNNNYHSKEKIKHKKQKEYYENHENNLNYAANYRKNHQDKIKITRENRKDKQRNHHLLRKYGINQEQFNKLLLEQNNKCAICGSDEAGGTWNTFYVDHIEKDGNKIVRGLLCFHCNTALGKFKENWNLLKKAWEYVSKYE